MFWQKCNFKVYKANINKIKKKKIPIHYHTWRSHLFQGYIQQGVRESVWGLLGLVSSVFYFLSVVARQEVLVWMMSFLLSSRRCRMRKEDLPRACVSVIIPRPIYINQMVDWLETFLLHSLPTSVQKVLCSESITGELCSQRSVRCPFYWIYFVCEFSKRSLKAGR